MVDGVTQTPTGRFSRPVQVLSGVLLTLGQVFFFHFPHVTFINVTAYPGCTVPGRVLHEGGRAGGPAAPAGDAHASAGSWPCGPASLHPARPATEAEARLLCQAVTARLARG